MLPGRLGHPSRGITWVPGLPWKGCYLGVWVALGRDATKVSGLPWNRCFLCVQITLEEMLPGCPDYPVRDAVFPWKRIYLGGRIILEGMHLDYRGRDASELSLEREGGGVRRPPQIGRDATWVPGLLWKGCFLGFWVAVEGVLGG
jgi:hypothetical protein